MEAKWSRVKKWRLYIWNQLFRLILTMLFSCHHHQVNPDQLTMDNIFKRWEYHHRMRRHWKRKMVFPFFLTRTASWDNCPAPGHYPMHHLLLVTKRHRFQRCTQRHSMPLPNRPICILNYRDRTTGLILIVINPYTPRWSWCTISSDLRDETTTNWCRSSCLTRHIRRFS